MFGLNLWTRPFFHLHAQHLGMNNSPHLPGALPPALAALASSAEGRKEGVSGFHSLGSQDKDLGSPYSAASFPMYRPGDPLPAVYSPLHHPFLRPHFSEPSTSTATQLNSNLRSSGAFHLVTVDDKEPFPSAFVPAKKAKYQIREEQEEDGGTSPRPSEGGSTDRSTPLSSYEEGVANRVSHRGESREQNSPDTSSKGDGRCDQVSHEDGLCCPVCRISLHPSQVQQHLALELQDLTRMLCRSTLNKTNNMSTVSDQDMTDVPRIPSPGDPRHISIKSRYETFLRIKCNRETRLGKFRGRRRRLTGENLSPCSTSLQSSMSSWPANLRQKDGNEDETVDVISFEEVETNSCLRAADDGKKPSSTSEDNSDGLTNKEKEWRERIKCSVCMEPYANPVTSIQCWHVHCESCWLKTLGDKANCPQCNMVTSTSDLRRLYI